MKLTAEQTVTARHLRNTDVRRANGTLGPMPYRAIAAHFGPTCWESDVWKALNPEARRATESRSNLKARGRKRAWDMGPGRLPCPNCGAPMGQGSRRSEGARVKPPLLCQACRNDVYRAQRDARRRAIEALWQEGLDRREIAVRLNSTPGSVQVELARMRASDEYDVPRRRAPTRGSFAAR